jgi:hypothetical protein
MVRAAWDRVVQIMSVQPIPRFADRASLACSGNSNGIFITGLFHHPTVKTPLPSNGLSNASISKHLVDSGLFDFLSTALPI